MEYIQAKNSLDFELRIYTMCSIRIRYRSWDIDEKLLQHNCDPYVILSKKDSIYGN